MDVFAIITLLGGLAFFLYGMNVLSSGLEKLAGGKLQNTLRALTSNPVKSLVLGAGITIAIQSSSAMTVMLVGLVNSGIMELSQTVGIIMGANIGTTLTAWILSLSGITSDNVFLKLLKPENFSPIFALVGIFMIMLAKNQHKKDIGSIFVGFAVLMYGMKLMSSAVSPLAETPAFAELLVTFEIPILGVIIAAVFTGIIQSSAAAIGILQALALTGSISCGMAIPLIMGLNIGTCMTAMLSSIGVSRNARRVAIIHMSIKTIGTVIFLIAFYIFRAAAPNSFLSAPISVVGIALFHSIFNIVTTGILMPFSKRLERLSRIIIRDREDGKNVVFLDERLLQTPTFAIAECRAKTIEMAHLARETLFAAVEMCESFDAKRASQIVQNEDMLDMYEDKLGSYLVKIATKNLSDRDSREVSKLLHLLGDLERIGDHAVNVLDNAAELHDKQLHFSEEAVRECRILSSALTEIINLALLSFEKNDIALANKVEPLEEVIDNLIDTIKMRHIERLQAGKCTITLGFILTDLLTNFERVSDHCSNIAVCVIELDQGSFDTHAYLHGKSTESSFMNDFHLYADKYSING